MNTIVKELGDNCFQWIVYNNTGDIINTFNSFEDATEEYPSYYYYINEYDE